MSEQETLEQIAQWIAEDAVLVAQVVGDVLIMKGGEE